MNRVRRAKNRGSEPPQAVRPRTEAGSHGNDNQPFDEKAWRKKYMREYMKKRRDRERAGKETGGGDAP